MGLFKRTSRRWRGVDFMQLVPQKACGWTEGTDGQPVVVLQPRYNSGLLGRFLQPRLKESKKYLRIPLEARGSSLWLKIDGKRTVGDLSLEFGKDFPEENGPIPERVATYLYQMAENRLIDFANLKI